MVEKRTVSLQNDKFCSSFVCFSKRSIVIDTCHSVYILLCISAIILCILYILPLIPLNMCYGIKISGKEISMNKPGDAHVSYSF